MCSFAWQCREQVDANGASARHLPISPVLPEAAVRLSACRVDAQALSCVRLCQTFFVALSVLPVVCLSIAPASPVVLGWCYPPRCQRSDPSTIDRISSRNPSPTGLGGRECTTFHGTSSLVVAHPTLRPHHFHDLGHFLPSASVLASPSVTLFHRQFCPLRLPAPPPAFGVTPILPPGETSSAFGVPPISQQEFCLRRPSHLAIGDITRLWRPSHPRLWRGPYVCPSGQFTSHAVGSRAFGAVRIRAYVCTCLQQTAICHRRHWLVPPSALPPPLAAHLVHIPPLLSQWIHCPRPCWHFAGRSPG